MKRDQPRSKLAQLFHSESGRPFLFDVQRERCAEVGDRGAIREVDRAAELWHRPPEEWELDLVGVAVRDGNGKPRRGQKLENWDGVYFGPVRLSYAVLLALRGNQVDRWPLVGGSRINPEVILRLWRGGDWWPDLVRFFGRLQIDVARLPDSSAIEFRPTSETLARNNAEHFPVYDPLH